MLFSDAEGHKVVSTSTAETVGRVHDFVLDPSGPRVAALLLKKAEGDTLRWSDILAFGTDAVTVEAADKITKGGEDLSTLLEKRNHVHKKRVLLTSGVEMGSVRDIDFDPADGTVTSFVLDDKSEIPGSRLIGVGSYAVVVQAETAPSNPLPPTASAAPTSAPAPAPAPADESPRPSADLSKAERASYPPAE